MSYLRMTSWGSAAVICLQVCCWRSQHCHAPSKTWVFGFTDLHLIGREGKKAPGPWGSWRKGPFVWQEQADAVESCSPRHCWSAAKSYFPRAVQKSTVHPDVRAFPCLLSARWCLEVFVFPKNTQGTGGSQCPARWVLKLSVCKQHCCCFVCLFRVLREGELEDKVTSVLNPWLSSEVKIPAERISLLCGENSLIIQTGSLYQHMSAISAGAASGVWG